MDNLELQNRLVAFMESGFEVLTESERFTHQLQCRFRMEQMNRSSHGWRSPPVAPMNYWMEKLWKDLWPEEWPAPPFVRWQLLSRCVTAIPPPVPLTAGPLLVKDLDETFDHCLRYGMDPGLGDSSVSLVRWRQEVWLSYRRELEIRRLFYPALLPQRLVSVLKREPARIPSNLVMVGFEFAGFWERKLLQVLCSSPGSRHYPLPVPDRTDRAVVYADPHQEVLGILEDLVEAAARYPLHTLGVVVLDAPLYTPLLAREIENLLGLPLDGEQAAYNLLPEPRLTDQPLYEAAFLPLTFAHDGESRHAFLGFLRSPYYETTACRSRALIQWDRSWREKGVEGGLEALIDSVPAPLKGLLPEEGREIRRWFHPLMAKHERPGSSWAGDLKNLWKEFGFPVRAHELDHVAWDRLQRLLDQFERAFGQISMTSREFKEWIQGAAEKIHVQRRGAEDAGIQILGGLEVRGMVFRRLYVPALLSGVLPQPVRALPFLTSEERKRVQGGTIESQLQFARHLFAQIHAAAPRVILSRPMVTLAGDIGLPSPFWPDGKEERSPTVIPWRHPLTGIQRARWVKEGIAGVEAHQKWDTGIPADLYHAGSLSLPEEMPVGAVEILVSCVARFFLEEILRIVPLSEIERGLDPRQRGGRIHAVVASLGREVRRRWKEEEWNIERLKRALEEAVDHELETVAHLPTWQIERRRLLGKNDRAPGLLVEWLRQEIEYLSQGWQWAALEASFSGLRLEDCPVTIRGRVDRIDQHRDGGVVCWDYKTGRIPAKRELWEELSFPQVPLYLMAIRKGLIREIPPTPPSLNGGYIELRSVRHLRRKLFAESSDHLDALLLDHEKKISTLVRQVLEGHITGRWFEVSCEVSCPYECLCGYRLWTGKPASAP